MPRFAYPPNSETGVTPGSYTYTSLTVDAYGRLTAASNGTAPITDHGGLTGLTGTDHHTQYVYLSPDADARNVVQPAAADVKALVLKGAGSQSDNLLETQDSSGNLLTSLGPSGAAVVGQRNTFAASVSNVVTAARYASSGTPAAGDGVGLVFQASSTDNPTTTVQTLGRLAHSWTVATHATRTSKATLSVYYTSTEQVGLTVQAHSGGTAYAKVGIGGDFNTARQCIITTADANLYALTVRAAGSQAVNIFTVEDSGGTPHLAVDKDGNVTCAKTFRITTANTAAAFSYGASGGVQIRDSTNTVNVGVLRAFSDGGHAENIGFGSGSWTRMRFDVGTLSSAIILLTSSMTTALPILALPSGAYAGSITDILTAGRYASSGTPAAGDGVALRFQISSTSSPTTTVQNAARVTASWGVATHASREGILSLYATDYGGDRLGLQVTGNGSATEVGLYGTTPTIQYATTGTTTGFTAGVGTPVLDDSTFTGNTGSTAYTISDIVRALKLLGVIAS